MSSTQYNYKLINNPCCAIVDLHSAEFCTIRNFIVDCMTHIYFGSFKAITDKNEKCENSIIHIAISQSARQISQ